jgi:hypothetical protein
MKFIIIALESVLCVYTMINIASVWRIISPLSRAQYRREQSSDPRQYDRPINQMIWFRRAHLAVIVITMSLFVIQPFIALDWFWIVTPIVAVITLGSVLLTNSLRRRFHFIMLEWDFEW